MSQSYKKPGKKDGQRGSNSFLPWIAVGIGMLLLVATAWLILDNRNPDEEAGDQPTMAGAPVIVITPSQIDFGDVKLGEVVTAEFTVYNQGDQPLRFTEAPYVELVEGC